MHLVKADVCKTTALSRDIQKQLKRQCYHTPVKLGMKKKKKDKREKRRVLKKRAPSARYGEGEAEERASCTELSPSGASMWDWGTSPQREEG